jgi:hypothetical protein
MQGEELMVKGYIKLFELLVFGYKDKQRGGSVIPWLERELLGICPYKRNFLCVKFWLLGPWPPQGRWKVLRLSLTKSPDSQLLANPHACKTHNPLPVFQIPRISAHSTW